jgi:hypothetical protein
MYRKDVGRRHGSKLIWTCQCKDHWIELFKAKLRKIGKSDDTCCQ